MPLTLHISIGLEPTLQALVTTIAEAFRADQKALDRIEQKVDQIIMDDKLIKDALDKIDTATTKIGTNVQTVADGLQTVSKEVDDFKTQLQSAGVSPTLIAQATSIADRVQAASDALDAQVPVLAAIAAKGASNPVPVAVPDTTVAA